MKYLLIVLMLTSCVDKGDIHKAIDISMEWEKNKRIEKDDELMRMLESNQAEIRELKKQLLRSTEATATLAESVSQLATMIVMLQEDTDAKLKAR